ncbi:MAG: 2-C-methyl-D-erythritol 4-phosphate cytidylyltransferase [Clostridia bacterium]|nr:2-C-methyl-D-erythritol 4-phosphate cytidylyltransferase [Clostridia bacterium]
MTRKTVAIIVAGGTGSRMNSDIPKQFLSLSGEEIISHTVKVFEKCDFIDEIIIVCHKDYIGHCKKLFINIKNLSVIEGGNTRQESVFNGLNASKDSKYVLIHDAVRCLVTKEEIKNLYSTLISDGSCTLAVKVKDTIKMSGENNTVIKTIPRENLWQIQTPQAFLTNEIYNAHLYAKKTGFVGTDDCSVMENANKPIILVEANYENIKITTPSDMEIAKVFLKGRK